MSRPIAVELAEWAAGVRRDDIPDRVADLALSQVISQLAAIRAGLRQPGRRGLLAAYGPMDRTTRSARRRCWPRSAPG